MKEKVEHLNKLCIELPNVLFWNLQIGFYGIYTALGWTKVPLIIVTS